MIGPEEWALEGVADPSPLEEFAKRYALAAIIITALTLAAVFALVVLS